MSISSMIWCRARVNEEYTTKNNLYSVKKVLNHLSNTYIIPCDIWCDKNPYHHHELYSWYMVSDLIDDDSTVRVNRKWSWLPYRRLPAAML